MRYIIVIVFALCIRPSGYAQITNGIPKVKVIEYQESEREWFVKYGQCQIEFELSLDPTTGLSLVKDPQKQIEKINDCLEIAKANNIDVLIFPECALTLPEKERNSVIRSFQNFAKENEKIIIGGSYYDKDRYSRTVIVLPDSTYLGYKIRPSKFEASPNMGEGMRMADTLLVFKTKFGNFLPVTCVDLISDDVNYAARALSNRGMIDMLININWNPASKEFMREASAMTKRHPLIVSITNVSLHKKACADGDSAFGNTSLFATLQTEQQFRKSLLERISPCFKNDKDDTLLPGYDDLVAQINPEQEGILNYEVNLRLIRPPFRTNAPDQGYPSIKNINIIGLDNLRSADK